MRASLRKLKPARLEKTVLPPMNHLVRCNAWAIKAPAPPGYPPGGAKFQVVPGTSLLGRVIQVDEHELKLFIDHHVIDVD